MRGARCARTVLNCLWLALAGSALAGDKLVYEPYTVAPGDTLSSIAKIKLGSAGTWKQLQALNRVTDPDVLRPGIRSYAFPRLPKRPMQPWSKCCW